MSPHLALHRFGFGVRRGEAVPSDPVAWLDEQTRALPAVLAPPSGRASPPSLAEGYAAWLAAEANPPPRGQRTLVTQAFREEQQAWVRHLLVSPTGFHDRLVTFWLNHFTVAERGGLGAQAGFGLLLRDVIRPGVTGRLADLLVGVCLHPTMLHYLNQVSSVGPNSPHGQRAGLGLNENLAREILELHTLSPAAGYTQRDVTEFARLMTGWTVERRREPFGTLFRSTWHEPGEKVLLGELYAEGGEAYERALRSLARHPATLSHVATRMVRHFIADVPPPAAVERIAAALRETDGDLGAAARALVRLPEADAPVLSKLRPPVEWAVAIHRAGGWEDPAPVVAAMDGLGQPLWDAPQPNGWPDLSEAWAGPEPVMRRLDVAYEAAGRFTRLQPEEAGESLLGSLFRPATRERVRRAGSVRDAFALLFTSPEMLRR